MSSSAAPPPSTPAASAASSLTDGPWLWRLLTTPVSVIVSGRITGWMRPERAIAAASLPAPLAALVLDVTKRSRLWRVEQAEIALELAAHFADGLASGRSIDQLIADFGDASQAARLLRRAAKRNRPWPWRAMRFTIRAAVFSFLALILIYGAMAVRFYLGQPGPITDFRPELNAAALAVKDDERAWPLYREALLRLPKPYADEIVMGPGQFNRMPHPGEEGWDAVETYLREAAPALELVRQAAAKSGLGLVVGYAWSKEDQALWPDSLDTDLASPESDGMFGILLPHLGSLRKLAQTLGWDAQRAAAAGDHATALADLRGIFAIARHVREMPIFIGQLVGLAALGVARDRIDAILAQQPQLLSDEELVEIAHALAAFDDRELAMDFSGERLFFNDVLQRLYTDDGSGDGRITPRGLRWLDRVTSFGDGAGSDAIETLTNYAGPALSTIMLSRRDTWEEYDRLMSMMEAEAATPLWQRQSSQADDILERWMASPIERIRHMVLCLMMPALSRASVNAELAMQRRDATITAIALELWRREHGDWPASLAELVPAMMPALPIDRFDGQPLCYRVIDGKPLLYSVGTDREDDGGVLPPTATADSRQWYAQRWVPRSVLQQNITTGRPDGTRGPAYDGDWLLWPPLPEEPLRQEDRPSNVSHLGGVR